jgi:hypothetical protein
MKLVSDTFEIIAKQLDGRDCARLRRVCKEFKARVDNSIESQRKIDMHFIHVQDMESLKSIISRKHELINISESIFDSIYRDALNIQYNVNVYDLNACDSSRSLLNLFFCSIEGFKFYRDRNTNQIVCATNFYFNLSNKCLHVNRVYECSCVSHFADFMRLFNRVAPGIFDFECIKFPFQQNVGAHEVASNDGGYHRGTCIVLRLNCVAPYKLEEWKRFREHTNLKKRKLEVTKEDALNRYLMQGKHPSSRATYTTFLRGIHNDESDTQFHTLDQIESCPELFKYITISSK